MMKKVTARDVAEATGGGLLCGDPGRKIAHISIDSRNMQGDDLFVPIIGAKVDAHRFIGGAFSLGAAATFTSEHDEMDDPDHVWIRVEDTVKALQDLGAWIRKRLTFPIVGITGSVGKTTTREMIAAALSAGLKVTTTAGNSNGQLGVPVTLCEMDPDAQIAVLEMGMSEPGEMARLAQIAAPQLGVVTNIGVSHIENLGSRERICEEKLHLADGFKPDQVMILNGDDDMLVRLRGTDRFATVFYGLGEENDFRAEQVQVRGGRTEFILTAGDRRIAMSLGIPGTHNVMNALAAMAVADHFGVDLEAAAEKLASFRGFARRLQIGTEGGYTYVDDTYNASPASMRAALEVLAHVETEGKRIAVLAAMLELGPVAPRYHYETGAYGATLPVDLVVTVGTLAQEIGRAYREAGIPVVTCETNAEAAEAVIRRRTPGDVILLKGSNGMHLGEVLQALKKG